MKKFMVVEFNEFTGNEIASYYGKLYDKQEALRNKIYFNTLKEAETKIKKDIKKLESTGAIKFVKEENIYILEVTLIELSNGYKKAEFKRI